MGDVLSKTRRTVYIGFFIGLTIILTRCLNIRISMFSFSGFPVILSGIIFGPIYGACVGGISDILGYMINSFGKPYHPGFTLTAALNGFIPGLLISIFNKNNKLPSLWMLILAIFTGQFITDIIMVPYFYAQITGKTMGQIKMVENIFTQLIHIPLYAFFINKILKVYNTHISYARGGNTGE